MMKWIMDKLGYVSKTERDQAIITVLQQHEKMVEPLVIATVCGEGLPGDQLFSVPFYCERDLHNFIKLVENGWKSSGLIKANVMCRGANVDMNCRYHDEWQYPVLERDANHDSYSHYFASYKFNDS